MKKHLLIGVMLTMAMALAGCGGSPDGSAEKEIWRLSHEESVGSIQDQYSIKFKEMIEERTNGRIQVDVYSLGQLGDSVGGVELVRYGVVNFSINNPATMATIVPQNQLFNLHYVFSDDMELNRKVLHEGETVKALNELYLEKDIVALSWFQEGFQVVTSNHAIHKPDDMKGFKIRVMASPMLVAAYEAYGANPTPVPYMETYSNLQLNMIDGQVNPVFAIEEMKFYEVQNYLNFMNHEMFVGTFCANPDFWESLSAEDKKMVEEIIDELDAYIFEVQTRYAEERLELIKSRSDIEIIEYTEEERAAFKERSVNGQDYYLKVAGEKGQMLLDMLEADFQNAQRAH